MKHSNISIFIPHMGCKNTCSFCNQHVISGTMSPPSPQKIAALLTSCMNESNNKADTEIAFFGGSFTAIQREYMIALLETASAFVGKDGFSGIRISTRPDAIDDEVLGILKRYGVTAIELGAQSMSDEVLFANQRGHSAADVHKAVMLIHQHGFSLGLQMMIGLYKDTVQGALFTANEFVKLKPDTVRIYPTVILESTLLGELYQRGEYAVMPLDTAVTLSAQLLMLFQNHRIKVIKLGLHASSEVESQMLGGIYHPAFRELCEGELYLQKAVALLQAQSATNVVIFVKDTALSKMLGQKKINIEKLAQMGYNVKVTPLSTLKEYELIVKDVQDCY